MSSHHHSHRSNRERHHKEGAGAEPRRKEGGKASGKSSSSSDAPISFLFVVNELVLPPDPALQYDNYGNLLPPTTPSGYSNEIPSEVFRYSNTRITKAEGYMWNRSGQEPGGFICRRNGEESYLYPELYKTAAVFACNPHLPLLTVNADPLVETTSMYAGNLRTIWSPPTFAAIDHPSYPLVSRVMFRQQVSRLYVAGRNPKWMPALVPKAYANPYNPPESAGLSGDLPIVIGLMAFAERANSDGTPRINDIFLGRKYWRGGEWHGPSIPKGYPMSSEENPRGFVVKVYLDNLDNEIGSTAESLKYLEWQLILVNG